MPESLLNVPQASPGRDYRADQTEIDAAVARVLSSGRYILGDEVAAFEREFATYLGVADCVAVANGTDAVELALRGLEIGEGSTVATVSHTAVATVAAIERAGATPLLVDIDPETMTLDAALLEQVARDRSRNPKTRLRAVVVVHLYGQPADLAAILDVAGRYGMRVVEDCAQSHGARFADRPVGAFGDAAAFSFYPTKNLAALGDGGTVATNDPAVALRVRELRQYGWRQRYVSSIAGVNSRLDELQAAVLRVRLNTLDSANQRRREIAARYDDALADTPIRPAPRAPRTWHVFHQYVVRSPDRDRLATDLADSRIGTAIHYPIPIHLQPAYKGRIEAAGTLIATERAASEILSLPMFKSLTDGDADAVVEALRNAVSAPGHLSPR